MLRSERIEQSIPARDPQASGFTQASADIWAQASSAASGAWNFVKEHPLETTVTIGAVAGLAYLNRGRISGLLHRSSMVGDELATLAPHAEIDLARAIAADGKVLIDAGIPMDSRAYKMITGGAASALGRTAETGTSRAISMGELGNALSDQGMLELARQPLQPIPREFAAQFAENMTRLTDPVYRAACGNQYWLKLPVMERRPALQELVELSRQHPSLAGLTGVELETAHGQLARKWIFGPSGPNRLSQHWANLPTLDQLGKAPGRFLNDPKYYGGLVSFN